MDIYKGFDVESKITTFLLDKNRKILKRVEEDESIDELVLQVNELFEG